MTKTEQLAKWCDVMAAPPHSASKAEKFQQTAAELRRLAAVEQENANLLAANKYTKDIADQALHDLKMCQQELADLKTAIGDPVAWAIFTDAGNARMWTTFQPHIQKLADSEGLTITPLYTIKAAK